MTIHYTPNLAIPYPDGVEDVSLGATDFQNVAQVLDGGSGASTSGPTAALVTKGTLVNLPAAGKPLGSVYICTDTACAFWSDGTKWHYIPIDSSGPPVGAIQQYGGSSDPVDPDGVTRWLICDGRAVSRTTYATLFSRLATTYGAGDGSTTFNIPDGRGRFLLGKAASGTGNTLGATGGNLDHTHALDSNNAGAQIGLGSGTFNNLKWSPSSAGDNTFSGLIGGGVYAIGDTYTGGTEGTGILAGLQGDTNSANPAYVVVNHIVRAL